MGIASAETWQHSPIHCEPSGGEAEHYSLLRGSCHGFGAKAMLRDLGVGASDDAELQIFSDSFAAR
eukprot:4410166-Pyramimonas_sp.AAC.1